MEESGSAVVDEHPIKETDASERLSEPSSRPRKSWLVVGAVGVLALGGALYAAWPDSSASDQHQAQVAPTFGTTSCTDGSRSEVGSKLSLTVNSIGSLDSSSFVFPASDTAQAHDVVSAIKSFGYPNIAKELAAGAYNYGDTLVSIKVDDTVPSSVTIYGLCGKYSVNPL